MELENYFKMGSAISSLPYHLQIKFSTHFNAIIPNVFKTNEIPRGGPGAPPPYENDEGVL